MLIGIGIGAVEIGLVALLSLAVGISIRRLVKGVRSSGRVDWMAVSAITVIAVVILGLVHIVRIDMRERDEARAERNAEQHEDEATLAATKAEPDRFAQAKATMCTEEMRRAAGERANEIVEQVSNGVARLSGTAANLVNAETAPAMAAWVSLCVADSPAIELRSAGGSLGFWSLDGGWSPGPALAPSSAPAPATEMVVASYEGKGQKKPQPFTVRDRWEVRWKAKGTMFAMTLYTADGEYVDLLANSMGADESSAFVPKGGEYYLDIRGIGRWSVQVVQLP
jgi:hypothetical protein